MEESKSKFVEWVEVLTATKGRRFGILLFFGVIGFFLLLEGVLFAVLKYLFSDNDNNSSLVRAMLLGVIGLVLAGQWVWGKPKIFTKRSNRFVALLFCAFLGLILGVEFVREDILNALFPDSSTSNNSSDSPVGNNYDRVRNSLVGVIMGLPVFVVLWVFRTMDTREGIEKTQKQIEKTEKQINFGLFSDAKKSFLSGENLKERTASFVQLVKLQQQKLFKEEIKIIFRVGELNRPTNETGQYHEDIEGAYLKGVDLRGIDLSYTRLGLEGAHLEGAKLQGANLREAYLKRAHLEGANLEEANLEEANLEGAKLEGAKLQGANLREAYLKRAKLEGANLQEANLQEAHLEGENLQGANLEGTHLEGAHLEGANLEGASLEGVNLEGASLERVNLRQANLQGAKLGKLDLIEVELRNAEFDSKTELTDADLTDALVSGTDPTDNALKTAGVELSPEQWDQLIYLPSDLRGIDLQEKNLLGANLQGENLQGANLQRAILGAANLQRAILEGANLEGANLRGTNLEGANLEGASLEGAQFNSLTNLTDANLTGTTISGSSRDDNALKNEGVNLSDTQSNQLDIRVW